PLLTVVALRRDLEDLPLRIARSLAHGRAHRRNRRRAGRDGRVRTACAVAERDLDVVNRNTELLRGDLRHRGARPGADVLHRRDDRRAAVRADADPRVRGRSAAAVPDLAREADAVLPWTLAARADLVTPLPVLLRAAVTLHQVLRGVRPVERGAGVGLPAELVRTDVV